MQGKSQVKILVELGEMNQKEFVFSERTHCIAGRDVECEVMRTTDDHISRHHCELDINPPEIIIRDLGSMNGTFINGEMIGQRKSGETPEQGRARSYGEYPLRDGDVLDLGGAVKLRIAIVGAENGQHPTQRIQPLETRRLQLKAERDEDDRRRQAFGKQARKEALNILSPEDYELGERPLGEGGMGMVFTGIHLPSGSPVAVKLIRPHLLHDGDAHMRYLRELRIMDRLSHPNIVGMRGLLPGNGLLCIVMELCNGGSLPSWIQRRGAWPNPRRAITVILGALEGLEHAHKDGIIHRDLKPGNLLMHYDQARKIYVPKIADFGLAKALDEMGGTATGTIAGTPEFMPRQQVMKFKYVEPDVDVWAMGAVLYWLLTEGKYPRDFVPGEPKVRQILHKGAVPIRQRNPALPAPLAELVDLAVTDNPRIGIGTATELRQRLEKVQAQL